MGTCFSQGMFFGIFVLDRVSILSIFVLNRVSFLRQEPITLFLDDKQPALMFYECLKLGIKNRNSVLNRVGKSAVFVLNRVRVQGAKPHLPHPRIYRVPPRGTGLSLKTAVASLYEAQKDSSSCLFSHSFPLKTDPFNVLLFGYNIASFTSFPFPFLIGINGSS